MLYGIKKRFEISSSHCLHLPYESKCNNQHGHNYIIEVDVRSNRLNDCSMVIDFTKLKKIVMAYDHQNLNEIFVEKGIEERTTAESLCIVLCNEINEQLPHSGYVYYIQVQESEGNTAYHYPKGL